MTGSTTRAGSTFGHYEIRGLLGSGGMGEVYEARDTVKDRIVALKILAGEHSGDETFRERFRRESHAAAQLQEPHVIPIHDWGEVDGTLYIDMRRVRGVDLRTLLQSGSLDPRRAVAVTSQIAAGLDAAHAVGLVHRDVKPENIIVTPDDFAYLVDFGIAESDDQARLTTVGTAIGSFAYMAPERFGAGNITPAVDVLLAGLCALRVIDRIRTVPVDKPAAGGRRAYVNAAAAAQPRQLVGAGIIRRSHRPRDGQRTRRPLRQRRRSRPGSTTRIAGSAGTVRPERHDGSRRSPARDDHP